MQRMPVKVSLAEACSWLPAFVILKKSSCIDQAATRYYSPDTDRSPAFGQVSKNWCPAAESLCSHKRRATCHSNASRLPVESRSRQVLDKFSADFTTSPLNGVRSFQAVRDLPETACLAPATTTADNAAKSVRQRLGTSNPDLYRQKMLVSVAKSHWKLLEELLPWVIGTVVALGVLGWLIVTIRSWFGDDTDRMECEQELLVQLREIRGQGDLSDEEFRSIKGRLASKIADSLNPAADSDPLPIATTTQSARQQSIRQVAPHFPFPREFRAA